MISHRWDLGERLVDYHEAWQRQRDLHEAVIGGGADTTLLLEHASVYTAGRRTARWDRPTDGTPVVDVDRGGRITWHGPGRSEERRVGAARRAGGGAEHGEDRRRAD